MSTKNLTETQKWIHRRIDAVRKVYSTFQCLTEKGIELPDEYTAYQISCPFHGADARPSARYYPPADGRPGHFYCYKCKDNLDSITLTSRFKGLRFMDALADLERRFRIKIPRRPEGPEIVEPTDRNSKYVSDKWQDVTRVLTLLESKLLRIRDKCEMADFTKFCRVMDAISYDYDKTQKSTPEMTSTLSRLAGMMDDISALPGDMETMTNGDDISNRLPDNT